MIARSIDEVATHFQHEHRQRQHEADPEPPRHVNSAFGSVSAVAIAGSRALPQIWHLPDLGVHRAGTDRTLGDGL